MGAVVIDCCCRPNHSLEVEISCVGAKIRHMMGAVYDGQIPELKRTPVSLVFNKISEKDVIYRFIGYGGKGFAIW